MFWDFFQTTPIPEDAISGTYSIPWVVLSYLIAVFASYVALDFAGRLREEEPSKKIRWGIGGGFAMGLGIWTMHFIGMIALRMPFPMSYGIIRTFTSLIIAVLASGFAFLLLKNQESKRYLTIAGGIILGLGIASMHYVGMGSMIGVHIHYLPGLFALSVLIAIAASEAALWLMVESNKEKQKRQVLLKLTSALIMGVAIAGMHYVGMAAAVFTPNPEEVSILGAIISSDELLISLGATTILIMGIALGLSTYKQVLNSALYKKNEELLAMQAALQQSQSQLMQTNQSLEEEIAQKTILTEELIHAKEIAETANKAKSSFLANMSHEIRTPLNGILGMTELALDTDLTAEQREFLTLAQSSGETLLALINQLLDFSKIEAGKLELDFQEFYLRDSLGSLLKTHAMKAYAKEIELIPHIFPDVPDALAGDLMRLRQVISNLLSNAIKFTDAGEIILRIQKEKEQDNKVILHFTITDTGIGISKEKQQLLFKPFTQVDSSSTRRFGGTGLGLAISARIIELMGGKIWVESNEGIGSQFHFTAIFQTRASKAMVREKELEGISVLIVDDNSTNCRVLEELLKGWKMKPIVAKGGVEATAFLNALERNHPIRLVLLDANMPYIDGFSVAKSIRRNPKISELPIIMLSSGTPLQTIQCQEVGIKSHIMKPVISSELFQAIRGILEEPSTIVSEEEGPIQQKASGSSLRILIAEDNPVNQQLTRWLCEKAGHEVKIAHHGKEAIEMLEKYPFDLILMDVQMPEMDGVEATKMIREREKVSREHIPIIAMTAHGLKSDLDAFIKAGMEDYILKPVNKEALYAKLSKVCQKPSKNVPLYLTFDKELLLSQISNDFELLKKLYDLFSINSQILLKEIKMAIEKKDGKTIAYVCHEFKGTLGNFAALEANKRAQELEVLGQENRFEEAPACLNTFEKEIEHLLSELLHFIQNSK